MKLHHLHEIVCIAERGSIRAAARHLNLAQPALTRSLAELERELGTPLFERRSRGVVPTVIGKAFIGRAMLILEGVRRSREEVDQLRGASTGSVTIGLSIAAHIALLPPALKPFRARYPNVRLHIIEGFYPTLETSLRDGIVDFHIGPDPRRPILPELSKEVLAKGRRTIMGRVGHPLGAATCLRDLQGADWITTSITSTAEDELSGLFESHQLPPPHIAVRSQSAFTLVTCLLHSDLLAMVPAQWLQLALVRADLSPIHVKEELGAPSIVLIRRIDLPLTPAATYLLDLMRRAQSRLAV